jgi:hypothetical protein
VRLYERALDAGEVAADMEAPIQTPRQGPVAAYSFDAGEGTTLEDLAGENNGTIEGAEWVTGKYGDALGFDGHSTCVSAPGSASLRLGEEFTIETWVKPEGTFGAGPLVSVGNEGSGGVFLGIGVTNEGFPEGWADGEEVAENLQLERGVWAHLALTYDGARLRLFVGGEQVASNWIGPEIFESEGPLEIGCGSGHEYAEARIDEVRIYQRALSAGEIGGEAAAPS